jgi:hypothetical protein
MENYSTIDDLDKINSRFTTMNVNFDSLPKSETAGNRTDKSENSMEGSL